MPKETDTKKAKTLIRGNSETLGRTFLGNNYIDIKHVEIILKFTLSDKRRVRTTNLVNEK